MHVASRILFPKRSHTNRTPAGVKAIPQGPENDAKTPKPLLESAAPLPAIFVTAALGLEMRRMVFPITSETTKSPLEV